MMATVDEPKKLGFGLMRLPRKGLRIDIEQVKTMVDLFMEAGFTYFDTAFVYPGSEDAARKALVERYPRESYTLATKLHAGMVPIEKGAKQELLTSLKRTGAGYFDYYLLHSLMNNNYRLYEKFHLWDFVREQKEKGTIRHYGFSFHAGPELLDQILTEHPDVEFVQLQINYADWENASVQSRANYEVARRHGKKVVIMEPVKGGALAKPPKEVQELFKKADPDLSYASWAIRFCASLDGVLAVLSGMSNTDQVRDNISYMKDFVPLNPEEQEVLLKAQRIMGAKTTIPCTACRYCMEECPNSIAIPDIFAAANLKLGGGREKEAVEAYGKISPDSRPDACIECRRCEEVCPQHIAIPDQLKKCAELLEKNS